MRGKGINQRDSRVAMRITPAYAGKSCVQQNHIIFWGDHPRVCGEKRRLQHGGFQRQGSPPRMRGKVSQLYLAPLVRGITPAYAGKSRIHRVCTDRHRDHPRVCGEKRKPAPSLAFLWGSPPRMRGKADSEDAEDEGGRITPAYAGKRLKRSHRIGHFSCILCLFHSVLHRASASGGSRAGPCAPPCLPAQNAVPV